MRKSNGRCVRKGKAPSAAGGSAHGYCKRDDEAVWPTVIRWFPIPEKVLFSLEPSFESRITGAEGAQKCSSGEIWQRCLVRMFSSPCFSILLRHWCPICVLWFHCSMPTVTALSHSRFSLVIHYLEEFSGGSVSSNNNYLVTCHGAAYEGERELGLSRRRRATSRPELGGCTPNPFAKMPL